MLTVAMAEEAMIKRLAETKQQHEDLTNQLGDPSLAVDEMLQVTKKRRSR